MSGEVLGNCQNCGVKVYQADVDSGNAFADGENIYCPKCVAHILYRVGRAWQRNNITNKPVSNMKPTREAPRKPISAAESVSEVPPAQKGKQHRESRSVLQYTPAFVSRAAYLIVAFALFVAVLFTLPAGKELPEKELPIHESWRNRIRVYVDVIDKEAVTEELEEPKDREFGSDTIRVTPRIKSYVRRAQQYSSSLIRQAIELANPDSIERLVEKWYRSYRKEERSDELKEKLHRRWERMRKAQGFDRFNLSGIVAISKFVYEDRPNYRRSEKQPQAEEFADYIIRGDIRAFPIECSIFLNKIAAWNAKAKARIEIIRVADGKRVASFTERSRSWGARKGANMKEIAQDRAIRSLAKRVAKKIVALPIWQAVTKKKVTSDE